MHVKIMALAFRILVTVSVLQAGGVICAKSNVQANCMASTVVMCAIAATMLPVIT